jgi:hypothetical protein
MIQSLLNLNTLRRTLSTRALANGLRNNTKTYSVAAATIYHSSSKHFDVLPRPFFSNFVFVIIITIGLIFNSIEGKNMLE